MPTKRDMPFMTRKKAQTEVNKKETEIEEVAKVEETKEKVKKEVATKKNVKKAQKEKDDSEVKQSKEEKTEQSRRKADTTKAPTKKKSAKKKTQHVSKIINTTAMDEIINAEKKKEILWGELTGAYIDNGKVVIEVSYKEVDVVIPEEFVFEKNTKFGRKYDKMNDEEKLEHRLVQIRHQLGSKVPFMIGTIKQNENKEMVVIGSRTHATEQLRDIYFIHKDTKNPIDTNSGDEIKATILYVGEDVIDVLCRGVEYRLDRHNSSNELSVENCKDFFKNGDDIDVRVKKVTITGNDVRIKLSARVNLTLEERVKKIKELTMYGTYLGFVDKVKNTGTGTIYTVLFASKKYKGINVSVIGANVIDGIYLNKGDRVSLQIINLDLENGFVWGKALRI